jgi:uncharacterized protein (DUF433 family)
LPVILEQLKNGNYSLDEMELGYEQITIEEIEKAVQWLKENYDYKSEETVETEEDES